MAANLGQKLIQASASLKWRRVVPELHHTTDFCTAGSSPMKKPMAAQAACLCQTIAWMLLLQLIYYL